MTGAVEWIFFTALCPDCDQKKMERETRLELATNSLEGCDSTN